tara:strand:+ start:2286 stop:2516 length:231 start_codon:yes stop_codon:yes gene_type:complete
VTLDGAAQAAPSFPQTMEKEMLTHANKDELFWYKNMVDQLRHAVGHWGGFVKLTEKDIEKMDAMSALIETLSGEKK